MLNYRYMVMDTEKVLQKYIVLFDTFCIFLIYQIGYEILNKLVELGF